MQRVLNDLYMTRLSWLLAHTHGLMNYKDTEPYMSFFLN
jgi:hypothetical protein